MSKFARRIHDRHVRSMRKQVDWIDNHYWRWMLLSIIPSVLVVAVFHVIDKRAIDRSYAFEDLEPPTFTFTFNDEDPDEQS